MKLCRILSVGRCRPSTYLDAIPRLPETSWHRAARKRRQHDRGILAAERLGFDVPQVVAVEAHRRLQKHHGTPRAQGMAPRADDWKCEKQGCAGKDRWNFARNERCFMCKAPRAKGAKLFCNWQSGGAAANKGGGRGTAWSGEAEELRELRKKNAKLEAELEKASKPIMVVDLETAKSSVDVDIAALEEDVRQLRGRVEAFPTNPRYKSTLAEAEKELAAAKRRRIDDKDPQERMRGALGKIKRLQGLQGRIIERLYDKEERIEKLEAELVALEVDAAEERASYAKLQADIEELELEHKRATVTADALLPMLKLWYEAYKAEPAGGVAEAQVDAAFNGIAGLLGQLDQHRAAVTEQQKEEEPPPTNVEDAIAASIPKPEVAAEVVQAVAAVAVLAEEMQAVVQEAEVRLAEDVSRSSQCGNRRRRNCSSRESQECRSGSRQRIRRRCTIERGRPRVSVPEVLRVPRWWLLGLVMWWSAVMRVGEASRPGPGGGSWRRPSLKDPGRGWPSRLATRGWATTRMLGSVCWSWRRCLRQSGPSYRSICSLLSCFTVLCSCVPWDGNRWLSPGPSGGCQLTSWGAAVIAAMHVRPRQLPSLTRWLRVSLPCRSFLLVRLRTAIRR